MSEMKLFKIHEKLSDRSRSNSQISLDGTEKRTEKRTEKKTENQNKLVKVAGLFKKKRLGSKWQVEGQKWRYHVDGC